MFKVKNTKYNTVENVIVAKMSNIRKKNPWTWARLTIEIKHNKQTEFVVDVEKRVEIEANVDKQMHVVGDFPTKCKNIIAVEL